MHIHTVIPEVLFFLVASLLLTFFVLVFSSSAICSFMISIVSCAGAAGAVAGRSGCSAMERALTWCVGILCVIKRVLS